MSTMMSDSVVETPTTTDGFMLTLTDMAAVKIQAILKERNVPDHGLRVFVAGGGCSGIQYGMALESQAQDTDTVIESSGLKLYVDPTSAEYLHAPSLTMKIVRWAAGSGSKTRTSQTLAAAANNPAAAAVAVNNGPRGPRSGSAIRRS